MSHLKYKPVRPLHKRELVRLIESGDPEAVAKALYAATKYEDDWSWVEKLCVRELKSPKMTVRWAAATCLGDLAFMRRPLDLDTVVPALEQAAQDPQIADPVSFSLRMIREFLLGK
jgi:hypothetical protein